MLEIIIVNSMDKRNRLKYLKKLIMEIRKRWLNPSLSTDDSEAENLKNETGKVHRDIEECNQQSKGTPYTWKH